MVNYAWLSNILVEHLMVYRPCNYSVNKYVHLDGGI